MIGLPVRPRLLAIVAGLIVCARGTTAERAPSPPGFPSSSASSLLQALPQGYRSRAQVVLDKPVLSVRGPLETFRCEPSVYYWLLDHPDRAVKAWLRLGARCTPIDDRGNGRFGYRDDQGSDVHWDAVVRDPDRRVWYAEGKVKASLLLPLVPIRAMIVLNVVEGKDARGRSVVRHQGEMILHIDSKAAALVTRALGASAPRLAEQYAGQIQTFFAALAWFLNEHPERVQELLAE